MIISLIWAMAENRTIGIDNDLPWRLPADLKFFKRTTLGHPIIMGRKTFESFGGRPLPKRRNIIVTRNTEYAAKGVEVSNDLDAAVAACDQNDEVFICGGSEIYRLMLPKADRLYVTTVHARIEGDTFFPEIDFSQWKLQDETHMAADEKHAYAMTWRTLIRQAG